MYILHIQYVSSLIKILIIYFNHSAIAFLGRRWKRKRKRGKKNKKSTSCVMLLSNTIAEDDAKELLHFPQMNKVSH